MAHISPHKIKEAITGLLKDLITIPSYSKEEGATADRIFNFLHENNIASVRKANNVWTKSKYFDNNKQTVLLNSHHDTVKPNSGYTLNPFKAEVETESCMVWAAMMQEEHW
jgi:acetylornithine deacetylase